MKKAARIMNILAIIFGVIGMIGLGFLFAAMLIGYLYPDKYIGDINKNLAELNQQQITVDQLKSLAFAFVIIMGVELLVYAIILWLSLSALRNLRFDTPKKGSHVGLLVFGILSLSIIVILAGSFGIAAAKQNALKNQQ